jgi:RND family efflux transporter MFP subunit
MNTRFAKVGNNMVKGTVLLRRGSLPVALGLLLAAFAGCKHETPVSGPVPVKVKVLATEEIIVSRRFSGSVEPLQSTALAFKLSGTVQRLYRPPGSGRDVQVGDTLTKGTIIAELDEGDLRRAKESVQARVAQLEARVATAKDNVAIATRIFERFTHSSGSVSEAARDEADAHRVAAAGELSAAENALAEARVALDQAIDNYDNRQLIVPFDHAIVAEKHIEPGERKGAHEVAFRLIDISTVHINFGVPDTMIGESSIDPAGGQHIAMGQELAVTAEAFEGRTLPAKVTKIAPQADPQARTFLTQLTLANQEAAPDQFLLRPGMIVTVRVGAQNDRKVMLLPLAAVHQGGGRSVDELTVYEAMQEQSGTVVRRKKVSLGGIYNNQVEVLPEGSDVHAGSRIVITTAERLSDGIAVQMQQENADSSTSLPEAK